MSVVPMQKVRLLVHITDVDAVLDIIQRAGALEFRVTDMTEVVKPEVVFPHANLLPRVQHAVHFMQPYAPKVSLWRTLRQGSQTSLTEKEVLKNIQDTDAASAIVDDLERLQVEFADVNEKLNLLEEQHNLLANWKSLPLKLSQLNTHLTTTLLVERQTTGEETSLKEAISRTLTEQSVPFHITDISSTRVAVTLPKDEKIVDQAKKLIEVEKVEIVTPPKGVETPDVEFVAISEELAAVRSELALLHDQAEHFAITHYKPLRVVAEVLSWQHARFAVVEAAGTTKYTVVFDGWLNQDKKVIIEQEFKSRGLGATFATLTPIEGDEPPVDIVNSAFVQPFELVTRLYGMPGYKDLDPTVFLAGFFFLFFGLSLTDVGYGLFLMVTSVIILTLFKVPQAIRLFAKLLLFVGFATVLVGMLFGGYFGIPPEKLPAILRQIQLFDPIGNPLPVFYLALGLGVFQVMAGMVIKIYSEAKNSRLMDGLLDQGPWLFMFCMAILYLATVTGYATMLLPDQIINLMYVGVVVIILSSGRHGKTIFEKIKSSAASLYSSIGYFSDILSYSRLLALGLATTALAFAVNLIAGMVVDVPYVGAILAFIILAIGHLFTLAVNTLGAFIHSARLQFVEFFGKFITGTGKEFAPLKRTEKYVTIIDD